MYIQYCRRNSLGFKLFNIFPGWSGIYKDDGFSEHFIIKHPQYYLL